MTIIKSEQLLPVDIDGTLICYGKIKKHHKALSYTCPYTKAQKTVRIHEPHVIIVKERLARGATILAWSASGYAKAEAVMRALGFAGHPNVIIMSKPVCYIDDIDCSEWMGKRLFLDPDCGYGK